MKTIMKKSTLSVLAFTSINVFTLELSAMEWLSQAAQVASTVDWTAARNAVMEQVGNLPLDGASEQLRAAAGDVAVRAAEAFKGAGRKMDEWVASENDRINDEASQKLEACDRTIRNGYSTTEEKDAAEAEKREIIRKRDADLAALNSTVTKIADGLDKIKAEGKSGAAAVARDAFQAAAQHAAFDTASIAKNVQQAAADSDFGDRLFAAAEQTPHVANKVAAKAAEKMHALIKTRKERIIREADEKLAVLDKSLGATEGEMRVVQEQRLKIIEKRDQELAAADLEIAEVTRWILQTSITVRNGLIAAGSLIEVAKEESASANQSNNKFAEPHSNN